ncbi:metal ABC transporter permease [Thermosynechococcaceae cyanobacterium BACA0444]|uniref:Metal ABC transporter permease n=1 Tax=Pseudocalidococcus azoricus BACA0444 TaxID=2918990 RepID=A0AAE4JUZ6_9CYAN|nr:metal ABC transporter permease [Pseudocalidococcus azoricus]MDS3859830.1 metal ABC transporter permease [Pseudocalidococcus azoricus BACA0444]
MSLSAELTRIIDLFQLPFMQRAVLSGILTGLMGGILGSFTILRQLSFFSDALGHSALLGISLGLFLGINPTLMLLPFAVFFALGVTYLLEKTQLSSDALLNIIYSSSLSAAIILLSFMGTYRGGLNNLLFGDILAVRNIELATSGILLILCVVFIALTVRTQLLITLHEPLAQAQGINVYWQRNFFIVLLALVVAVSIRAVGVLLISAFIVIPACAARLLSQKFSTYVVLAALLGASSAVMGMLVSAAFNLPSGPSIVCMQMFIFISAAIHRSLKSLAH